MSGLRKGRHVSTWLLTACGVWLVGLGLYFIVRRPPLLPEDTRFIGTTLAQLRAAAPGLEGWLGKVFIVMGGFIASSGVLTVFVATVAIPRRLAGTAWVVAFSGALSVALMSATNFALQSDFKWVLIVPALGWLAGLVVYLTEPRRSYGAGSTSLPRHHESSAVVPALPEYVFALIDDHERLSSHMNKPSWRMGGGSMTTTLDARRGQAVGSHILVSGRILGLKLSLDEVVTEREPPTRKRWETVGSPRLLVIGSYRMGFKVTLCGSGSLLRVVIDYALPSSWPERWVGRVFGAYYAQWCTQRMVDDAVRHFASTAGPTERRA
jgi:hypothetical protein